MPDSDKKKIDSLEQQLEELKVVYEELIANDKKSESLKQINNQIVQLEKAIQELSSK
jgi:DNA repair exonuclease SbcCD ATPase subunit